ncbi:MAG: hypothetical protein ACI8WT_000860 [Clostridium sp.]|jgi:hypothetical protein
MKCFAIFLKNALDLNESYFLNGDNVTKLPDGNAYIYPCVAVVNSNYKIFPE